MRAGVEVFADEQAEFEDEDSRVPTLVTRVEDDEDDEDEPWEEPFSLLLNLVGERFRAPLEIEDHAALEVIHYAGDEVIELTCAGPGQAITVGLDRFELVRVEDNRAVLTFDRGFSGTLVCRGKARPLAAFCNDSHLVEDELYGVVLREGDFAQLVRAGTGYLIRFVRPPRIPERRVSLGLTLGGVKALGGSLAVHLLLLSLVAVLMPGPVLAVEDESVRRRPGPRVSIDVLGPREPTRVEPISAGHHDRRPDPGQSPPTAHRPSTAGKAPGSTGRHRRGRRAVIDVMAALDILRPGAGAGRSDLSGLASNLSGVRSPGGLHAPWKVSDVSRRLGDGGVSIGIGSGDGGRGTRGAGELLGQGSKVGRLGRGGSGPRRPRVGVIVRPTRDLIVSGQCDRAVIQRVVGAAMPVVQSCYERELAASPGLAGKATFDWTIVSGGGVGRARMLSSSLPSPQVASCILGLIRTWRFSPCPIGGPVEVRYPFVFQPSVF